MPVPQHDSHSRVLFFRTVPGRIVTALGIIALVLGIVAEGISIYNGYLQLKINQAEVIIKNSQSYVAEQQLRAHTSNPLPDHDRKIREMCASDRWKDSQLCKDKKITE